MIPTKGGRILGTYQSPTHPNGASKIIMAIAPWYSTHAGTTKNIIAQGISSGSRHNLAVSWFRSSNGFDANDMQNHVVHFHLDGITASTTVVFGWYFRSEGGNTTYSVIVTAIITLGLDCNCVYGTKRDNDISMYSR